MESFVAWQRLERDKKKKRLLHSDRDELEEDLKPAEKKSLQTESAYMRSA